MPRRKGDKDLKKRKRIKKKPKNIIKFKKVEGHKTELKIWVWERKKMTAEGRKRWNPKLRPKIKPFTYRFGIRVDVPVEEISNIELVENWAENVIGYDGYFYIMGCSGSLRSKERVKWVPIFEIAITDSSVGLKAKLVKNRRGFRYWFWRG